MSLWPKKMDHRQIFMKIFDDARPDGYFFVMVVLSCTVATYGLLSNSTAVVIGAMLIAPLMVPILGGALAIAANKRPLLWAAARAEAAGSVSAVILAAVLTMILPHSDLTPEVLARTNPTMIDLVIALASGAAGTYSICVRPQSAALPGVAIATALMPPLCTAGIGLAKQDFGVTGGAILLFLANMIAIHVAAIATFELAGFSDLIETENANKNKNFMPKKHRYIYPVVLLVAISIPLALIMYKTYDQAHTERIIKDTLHEALDMIAPQSTLLSAEFKDTEKSVSVDAAFRTTKIFIPENIRLMENFLELKLGKPVHVSADVVLVQKVNNQKNIDSFKDLLPKVKEKEIVEVVRSSTPEEVIESTVKEKLSLLPALVMKDYRLEYRQGTGTYNITVELQGTPPADDQLRQSIQNILEDRLKRRVSVSWEIPAVSGAKEKGSAASPSEPHE